MGNPSNAEELVYRLDTLLQEVDLKNDFRRTALVALAFCDLLIASLDDNQKNAVEAARSYLAETHLDRHRIYVTKFAGLIDADRLKGTDRRQAATNRLVWSALNTNTEFSGYAAEFLVGLGVDAGLSIQEMSEVFSEQVLGF